MPDPHPAAPSPRRRRRRRGQRVALRPEPASADGVVTALVWVSVIGSALAVGSVHPPWILAFCTVVLLASGLTLWTQGTTFRDVPAPTWVLWGVAAYTLLQALPLPFSWLAAIAPANASVWAAAYQLTDGGPPGRASLSIDPGATLLEALKWLTYGSAFLTAAALGRRKGALAGAQPVFASAAVVAVVTVGHAAASATSLYGLYEPIQAHPTWAIAPLLNPNNLAGYLNLGLFAGLGLLIHARNSSPRWLLVVATAVVVAVSIMSGSRAGAAALAMGAVLLAPVLWSVLRTGRARVVPRLSTIIQVLAVLLGGIGLFVLGATDRVWRELLAETGEKVRLLSWTRPLIEDHWLFGVGRGAYETAFPPYRESSRHIIYQHAENFAVDWMAGWGLPVAITVLLLLGWFLRPTALGVKRSAVAATGFVGVVVLGIQNLLDLGLELLSVGLAVATLLGAMWGRTHRGRHQPAPPLAAPRSAPLPPRRYLPVALGVVSLATLVLAAGWGTQPVLPLRLDLETAYHSELQAKSPQLGPLQSTIRQALRWHPGDPYLPLLGALVARRLGENPLPWIGQAIERDPHAARPHLLLAEVLAHLGAREQALLEVRLALEREPLVKPAAALVTQVATSRDEILSAAPPRDTALLLEVAAQLDPRRTDPTPVELIEESIRRAPGDPATYKALGQLLLRALSRTPPRPPCDQSTTPCVSGVEQAADKLRELDPTKPTGTLMQAELLLTTRRESEAARLLRPACEAHPQVSGCWVLLLQALEHAPDAEEEVSAAASALLAAGCRTSASCTSAARTIAATYERRGNWRAAADMHERAARESGNGADWLRAARCALNVRRVRQTERDIEQARRHGATPEPGLVRGLEAAKRAAILQGLGR